MDVQDASLSEDGRVGLHLSRAELTMIAGALLETLEAVDDWEFLTRLGWEKSDFRALQDEFSDLIRSLPPES